MPVLGLTPLRRPDQQKASASTAVMKPQAKNRPVQPEEADKQPDVDKAALLHDFFRLADTTPWDDTFESDWTGVDS